MQDSKVDPRTHKERKWKGISFFNKECALQCFKVLNQHVYHVSSND